MLQRFVDQAAVEAEIAHVQSLFGNALRGPVKGCQKHGAIHKGSRRGKMSKGIAHFPLDILGKQSVMVPTKSRIGSR